MERLRIEYETGYMELNIAAFFPCPIQKERKIAKLINRYCSDETRAELLSTLCELADGYAALCGEHKRKMSELSEDSSGYCYWRAQFNRTETLRKRMERNIRLIQ